MNKLGQNKVVGVLLAAGQGQRFGGDKCLAPLADGTPMALRAALNLQPAVDELLCVVRPEDRVLKKLFQEHGFATVDCKNALDGMSASLMAGVQASKNAQAWLIALADMPLIKATTYQTLVAELREQSGIVRPSYLGQAGHPVLFSQAYYEDLLSLSGDSGAKPVLRKHSQTVRVVAVDDNGILQDFDTPESLSGI